MMNKLFFSLLFTCFLGVINLKANEKLDSLLVALSDLTNKNSAGYGAGVSVESNNPANRFNYVNMAHLGSYWAMEYSSLFVGGRLEIDNSSISNSNSWAIYVDGSSTLISNGATQVAAAGVMVTNSLTGNVAGADADCIGGGCTVFFE
jgi:hypothetical protein